MRKLRGYILVTLQLACLGVIALTGPLFPALLPARLVLFAAVFVGLWAVLSMGVGRFQITPSVHRSGRSYRAGPYRFVRHPMYLALLVAILATVLSELSAIRLAAWLSLVVVLVQTLRLEERLLTERYPEYASYVSSTRRLLPFVY